MEDVKAQGLKLAASGFTTVTTPTLGAKSRDAVQKQRQVPPLCPPFPLFKESKVMSTWIAPASPGLQPPPPPLRLHPPCPHDHGRFNEQKHFRLKRKVLSWKSGDSLDVWLTDFATAVHMVREGHWQQTSHEVIEVYNAW